MDHGTHGEGQTAWQDGSVDLLDGSEALLDGSTADDGAATNDGGAEMIDVAEATIDGGTAAGSDAATLDLSAEPNGANGDSAGVEQTTAPAYRPLAIETSAAAEGNLIEIVGPVLLQRRRGKEQVALTNFSRQRGARTQLYVQINEEHGDTYALTLYFPARTAEDEALIESLQEGERIRAVGQLSSRETYDTRFVTNEMPLGRPMRELMILVLRLERATEDDLDGSWVTLTGTIATPPRLRRHEIESSMEIARTSLFVQVRQPSRRPGCGAIRMKEDRIPIDVPMALPNAGAALARHNSVAVQGWLEVYRARLNPEFEPLVAAALSDLEATWAAEAARLQGRALEEAQRTHARRLRAMLYEDRLRVRVGQVELLGGTAIDDRQAVEAHYRQWNADVQARREAARQRRLSHGGSMSGATTPAEPPALESTPAAATESPAPRGGVGTRHRKRLDRSLAPGAIVGRE